MNMWTRICLSISCYVSFIILTKSVDRWTSNENSEKRKKHLNFSLFESVDLWTRSSLSISCYVSFIILTKNVDRWTSNENSEKKRFNLLLLFLKSVDMWSRSCFSLKFFFLPCTLQNFDKKV